MESIENKKVEEVMHHGVVTVTGDTYAKNMCKIMAEHHISCVIVKDANGKITGVVSDTDIMRTFEKCKEKCKEPGDCPVKAGDMMTTNVITVTAGDSLKHAIGLLNENGIHRLLVLSGGNPAGILSTSDIAKEIAKTSREEPEAFYSRFEKYERLDAASEKSGVEVRKKKIYEVMTSGVIMVPITAGIKEVSKILSEKDIKGVVVKTDDGEMIGIVSDIDILKAFTGEFEGRTLDELIAGDVMTQGIESIDHFRPLEDAARIMNDKHIHRLLVLFERPCEASQPPGFKRKPIVTRGIVHGVNIPVGILSASDMVQEIAKS